MHAIVGIKPDLFIYVHNISLDSVVSLTGRDPTKLVASTSTTHVLPVLY